VEDADGGARDRENGDLMLHGHFEVATGGVIIALAITVPAAEILHEAAIHHVFHREILEGMWDVGQREGLDSLLPATPGV
jgi:hypothetical protein